jgi:hypothetical protein
MRRNDEARMTNDEWKLNDEIPMTNNQGITFVIRASSLVRHSSFVIRHIFNHVPTP